MSKKKEKSVSLRDLEGEIIRLESPETEPGPEPSGLTNFFGDLLKQQFQQHAELLQALSTSSQSTKEAIVTAVKDSLKPEQQPAPRAAHTVTPTGLFDSEGPLVQEGAYSSDEEGDFHGCKLRFVYN